MSNIPVHIWFGLIPSCIVIGIIDYLLFQKWLECEICGHKSSKWYSFIIPTFIEIILFLAGIGIGFNLVAK